jgi:eukaryotic-like serine/threonine-protein kinase
MGAVYEALHTGTGRRVALKIILTTEANASNVARFEREAKAAGAIDTQHIAHVFDTGTDSESGHPFMVMEYLAGEDTQQFLERVGPLHPDLTLRIVAQALVGLQKAHEAGVVHRDIKPANLFLSKRDDGEIVTKVLDFGIAKVRVDQLAANENPGLTRTGHMLGSPLYMSPEQARGAKAVDERTDIWSLGTVMYELLTGRTPHHDVDSLGQLIININAIGAPNIQGFAPWVSPEIAAIVHKALEIPVDRRFKTAKEMLFAVREQLPNGWTLNETMLAPMSDSVRVVVAHRFERSGESFAATAPALESNPDVARAMMSSGPHPAVSMNPDFSISNADSKRTIAATPEARALSLPEIAEGQQPHVVQKRRRTVLLSGVAVGAVALAIFLFETKHAATASNATTIASTTAMITQPPSAGASTTISAPSQSLPRTVHVKITPPSAIVEVDHAMTTPNGGMIDIAGDIGSVHRVGAPGRPAVDVVIAESGAVPDKIDLTPTPQARHAAGARPANQQNATGATTAPASTKTTGTAIDKSFE